MPLKQRLIADWHWVLTHSWSVRLLAVSALLDGAEVILPLCIDSFPKHLFMVLSFFTTVAAILARFALQQRQGKPDGS